MLKKSMPVSWSSQMQRPAVHQVEARRAHQEAGVGIETPQGTMGPDRFTAYLAQILSESCPAMSALYWQVFGLWTHNKHEHVTCWECRAVLSFSHVPCHLLVIWDWLIVLSCWSCNVSRKAEAAPCCPIGWQTLGAMCTTIMVLSTLALVARQHFFGKVKM